MPRSISMTYGTLDIPSFLIDCRDCVPIRCRLTAGGASVPVCKDLPGGTDRKLQPLQPTGDDFLFRPFYLIYAGELFVFTIFLCQRDETVTFQCTDKLLFVFEFDVFHIVNGTEP